MQKGKGRKGAHRVVLYNPPDVSSNSTGADEELLDTYLTRNTYIIPTIKGCPINYSITNSQI